MPTRTINGATISYTDSGQGTPLVLVHAFPLDSRMWQHQIAHFLKSMRVIAPDLRGFGKSTSIESFSINTLADDVRALLVQLEALPCVLCGLSMGGYIALEYVRKCPADLRGLVLADTRAEADATEAKANRNKMIELVRSGGSGAVAEQMLPKLLAQSSVRQQPHLANSVREMIQSCPPRTIEHALVALRDRDDHLAELASIAVPTLIIVGAEDALTPPAMSQVMHENIPRSQLAIIPDAGHLSPMEQPEAVNREMERFVQSLK